MSDVLYWLTDNALLINHFSVLTRTAANCSHQMTATAIATNRDVIVSNPSVRYKWRTIIEVATKTVMAQSTYVALDKIKFSINVMLMLCSLVRLSTNKNCNRWSYMAQFKSSFFQNFPTGHFHDPALVRHYYILPTVSQTRLSNQCVDFMLSTSIRTKFRRRSLNQFLLPPSVHRRHRFPSCAPANGAKNLRFTASESAFLCESTGLHFYWVLDRLSSRDPTIRNIIARQRGGAC